MNEHPNAAVVRSAYEAVERLADDRHAAVLLEATVTLGGRSHTSRHVDVYRLRDDKATEHWHLPLDPKAEEKLFPG